MKKVIFITFFVLIVKIFAQENNLENAIRFINNQEYDSAISLLKEISPNEILLAISYLGKKDFMKAEEFALKCWQKNNNDILANYILALISEEKKEYGKAIFYWRNVLNNTKDNSLKQLAKKHIHVLRRLLE